MLAAQINSDNCLYCTNEEVVVYSISKKQTYLLSVEQSSVLNLYLAESSNNVPIKINDWLLLCVDLLKIDELVFSEVVTKLTELGIVDVVKCE